MDFVFSPSVILPALASLPNAVGSFSVYFLAGIAPCVLWLFFYLKRDRHPEPKKEIVAVFALGALMTAPAVGIEIMLINFIAGLGLPAYVSVILSNVIAIAFVEEFAKYAAVWLKEQAINQNHYLDEPVDFVIYMVVSALGFAAVENFLFLLPTVSEQLAGSATLLEVDGAAYLMSLSLFRSMSAILLHTLCSGIVGYYMALAFCHRERKLGLLATAFFTVSCLHGLYNFSIMESAANLPLLAIPLLILLVLAIVLYIQFQKLLEMKSVCNMRITKSSKRKA